jgi:IS605 OrfB family transposase
MGNRAIGVYFAMDKRNGFGGKSVIDFGDVAPETAAYREAKDYRRYMSSASLASVTNAAKAMYRDSKKYNRGIPCFRSSSTSVPMSKTTIDMRETSWIDKSGNKRSGAAFFFKMGCFQTLSYPSSNYQEIATELIAENEEREAKRKLTAHNQGNSFNPRPYPKSPEDIPKEERNVVMKSVISKKDGMPEIDGTTKVKKNLMKKSGFVVKRVLDGEFKALDSRLMIGDDGRLYFLLCWKDPGAKKKKGLLDPKRVGGIDLGVKIPAVCAVSPELGPARLYVGEGELIRKKRSEFRAKRRDNNRRGMLSGKKRTDICVDKRETRWVDNLLHNLTRQIVDWFIANNLGTMKIENLASLRRRDADSEYKMLMWTPQKLQEMLKYKSKEAGIKVHVVSAAYTSQTCSECGHRDKESRKSQSFFECTDCGTKMNADYNAARNIAMVEVSTESELDEIAMTDED